MKLKDIKLNPSNPRVIKDNKFKQLVQSIQDFPQMLSIRPIVVNDEMIVLGGNMRLRACQEAKLKEIPVLVASELTPAQQQEFIIKDNVSYGVWDWDVIANEWSEDTVVDWGLDIPKFTTVGDIEAKGRMAATLDEKLDTYMNGTIKQVVLYYEFNVYEKIIQMLDKVAQENNLEDNSSVLQHLLDKYES
jgi:hypothetical protein